MPVAPSMHPLEPPSGRRRSPQDGLKETDSPGNTSGGRGYRGRVPWTPPESQQPEHVEGALPNTCFPFQRCGLGTGKRQKGTWPRQRLQKTPRDLPSTGLLPSCPQQQGLGQAEARSQEPPPDLPCGWRQGLKHLSQPLPPPRVCINRELGQTQGLGLEPRHHPKLCRTYRQSPQSF